MWKACRREAYNKLKALDIKSLDLYVTGLTVALVSVLNACRQLGIVGTLYHYDREEGNYYPAKGLVIGGEITMTREEALKGVQDYIVSNINNIKFIVEFGGRKASKQLYKILLKQWNCKVKRITKLFSRVNLYF